MANQREKTFTSFIGGQHEGINSMLIPPDQYRRGVNISAREGLIRTRPVFKKIPLTESDFLTGKFQGAGLFRYDGEDRIFHAISGRIFSYNTTTGIHTDVSDELSVGVMDANVDHMYFLKAHKYFIIQDNENPALIMNHSNDPDDGRRAIEADNEVPIGSVMAYGHGRIFIKTKIVGGEQTDGKHFAAGDILIASNPTTVLKFIETEYLATGGSFSLSNEMGEISAMAFTRNVQTGTGLGPLIVFAENGSSSFDVNLARTTWVDNDISHVLFEEDETGTYAYRSIISINNDLHYRGKDGWRSLGFTINDIGGRGNDIASTSISSEMTPIFKEDDIDDMKFSSSAFVNNRIIIPAYGETDLDGHYFKALVSADSSVISALGQSTRLAWDGFYTGLKFMQVIKARYNDKDTLFVFARDAEGENGLYYLDEESVYDLNDSKPVCRLYTSAINFSEKQNSPDMAKFLFAEIWFTDIKGDFGATLYYRPFGYPLWADCNSMSISVEEGSENASLQKIRFTPDADYYNGYTEEHLNLASDFEFCIQITGNGKFYKVRFVAETNIERMTIACNEIKTGSEIVVGTNGIELDDFDYVIE